jgi:hypothetical protein
MDWVITTDKLGRVEKEYYPYTVAVHGADKYRSVIYGYDRASRRRYYSDPTYGHTAASTTGWTDHTEPDDEDDWVFEEPVRYLYQASGGLAAMGRVSGNEVQQGEGEPYFVKRDSVGRITEVIYPNETKFNVPNHMPEYKYVYEYNSDGSLKKTALVTTSGGSSSSYGPEIFVVESYYDDAGRLVKKVVSQYEGQVAAKYETDYEYDGRGQITRERFMHWNGTGSINRMEVWQDKRTTYDLGGKPVTIEFYDQSGKAYKETRTCDRGLSILTLL